MVRTVDLVVAGDDCAAARSAAVDALKRGQRVQSSYVRLTCAPDAAFAAASAELRAQRGVRSG